MRKRRIYFILILLSCFTLFSQEINYDSIISSIPSNEEKVKYLRREIGKIQNSNVDLAFYLEKKQLEFAKLTNNPELIGNAYNDLGNQYSSYSNYSKALAYFIESINYFKLASDSVGLSYAYHNIAVIYAAKFDGRTSKSFLLKSIQLFLSKKDSSEATTLISSLGDSYRNLDIIDSAMFCYKFVIRNEKDSNKLSTIYNNVGLYYFDSGNNDSALKLFKLSLNYNISNDFNRVIGLNNLGDCLQELNRNKEALLCYRKAYELAVRLNNPELIMTCYSGLADYFKAENRFDSAFYFLDRYAILSDSLRKTDSELKMADYKSGFDREAKEQEIKIQQLENQKREQEKKSIILVFIISAFSLILIIGVSVSRYKAKKQSYDKLKVLNDEVITQKQLVEEKQKEIIDSINYAKRIQFALLANENLMKNNLPEHFVLFLPKDIVSGDFYWASKVQMAENEIRGKTNGIATNSDFFLAVCDSTGHGVPGAFMSLLSIGFLSEAINEIGISQPNEIFNYVRLKLIESVGNEGQQDGFDGTLIKISTGKNCIEYASAHNEPIIISGGILKELFADKMPVGKGVKEDSFTLQNYIMQKGDVLYLFTDGFADQFGGKDGKKFKYKRLKELLLQIHNLPLQKQKEKIKETFNQWKGNLEQVDDVTVIGIKF